MMMRRADNYVSRAERSLHKTQLRSTRLQAVHKYNRLSQTFDEQVDEEEQKVLDLICNGDEANCEAERID